jgi:hypothetical protein
MRDSYLLKQKGRPEDRPLIETAPMAKARSASGLNLGAFSFLASAFGGVFGVP